MVQPCGRASCRHRPERASIGVGLRHTVAAPPNEPMPELPEVENLRRSLEPWLVGTRIVEVEVRRRSVVARPKGSPRTDAAFRHALGLGGTIVRLRRHGKQFSIEFDDDRALIVQLGMTGGVRLEQGAAPTGMDGKHRHVIWRVETTLLWPHGTPQGTTGTQTSKRRFDSKTRFVFRDPRRFGGISAGLNIQEIDARWSLMGPDALTVGGNDIAMRAKDAHRPIKSFLLDQNRIAGVGNIYADESLFAAKIHPCRLACTLQPRECDALARELRRILNAAVISGGSTLRDYRDAFGRPGDARQTHHAYGRAGLPCTRCGTMLLGTRLLGRTTVHCPVCQDLSTRPVHGAARPDSRSNRVARPS